MLACCCCYLFFHSHSSTVRMFPVFHRIIHLRPISLPTLVVPPCCLRLRDLEIVSAETPPPHHKGDRKSSISVSGGITRSRYTGSKWPWSYIVPCLKWMELGCQVLLDHFGFVHLLQASKNDDEELCFLK